MKISHFTNKTESICQWKTSLCKTFSSGRKMSKYVGNAGSSGDSDMVPPQLTTATTVP